MGEVMARGINKVILVGNLGNDPEISYTKEGKAVAKISVATSEKWKDKQGQQQERTEWHRVSAFGRLAEIMGEYLKKGSQVYIEGKLRTSKWQHSDGSDRYTTEILANELQMLGGNDGQSKPTPNATGGAQSAQGGSIPPVPDFDDFEDEIPF